MDLKIRQSELSQWRSCRRKTAMQYWTGHQKNRHPATQPPSKADIGTLIHLGLEHYYRDGKMPHVTVWEEAKRVEAYWAEQGFAVNPEWKDAFNLGYLVCEGYIQWLEETGADAGMQVTGVERELEVPWGNVQGVDVTLVGHIDLEGIDQYGRPFLMDHKSVAGIAPHEGPIDFQRLTYAVMREMEDGTSYAALYHNQLKRSKRTARATPPFYARQEVVINRAQLDKHKRVIDIRVAEIVEHRLGLATGALTLASPEIDASPSKDCSWSCPFYHVCPMMDDGGDWAEYLDLNFQIKEAHVPGTKETEQ